MSRRVLVIGGSDQGRQSIDVLQSGTEHAVVGVLDDHLVIGTDVAGHAVVGPTDALAECARGSQADGFLVAVGDNLRRGTLYEAARRACPDLEPVSAVHPRAFVASDAELGAGATLMAGAVVSNGCRVAIGALVGTNASIDHDGELGDFVSLGPGATTGGQVTIGSYTAICVGASVISRVTIGAHSVVGAGAVVLDDVPGAVVAHGVPARVVRARVTGEPYL